MLHANRGELACTASPHYGHQQLRQLMVSSMGSSQQQLRQLTVSSMGYSHHQLRQTAVTSMGYSHQHIRQLTISSTRLLKTRKVGAAHTLQCLFCQQQILLGIGIPSRILGHTWPTHHSSSRAARYPPALPPCPHQHQQSETGHSQCRCPSPSTLCTPRPTSLSVLANKTTTSQLVIHCHSSQHLSLMRPLYGH